MTVPTTINLPRSRRIAPLMHTCGIAKGLRLAAAAVLMLAWTLSPIHAWATPTSLTKDGIESADRATCVIVGDLRNYEFSTNDPNLFVSRPEANTIYARYKPAKGITGLGASKWFQIDYPNAVLDTTGHYRDLHVRVRNIKLRWGKDPGLGTILQRVIECRTDHISIDVNHGFPCNSSYQSVSTAASNSTQAGLMADFLIWAGDFEEDATLTYNLYMTDFDGNDMYTGTYEGEWSEAVKLGPMYDTIHVEPNTYLRMGSGRIYGSQTDYATFLSAFVSLGTMSASQPLTFTWSGSEVGTAILRNWSHVITAKASAGGSVVICTGSGTTIDTPFESISDGVYRTKTKVEAVPRNDYMVTATPDDGYEISEMLLDGVSLGATDSIPIEAISADHTICAVFTPSTGKIGIEKTSSNPTITDQNPCYTLEGAVYDVYGDGDCTTLVTTLSTDEHGVTELAELPAATYWLRESTAPMGYALDSQVHEIACAAGSTTVIPLTDDPLADPVELLVQKVDAETGRAEGQGSATLAGAEFTARFYAGHYEADSLPVAATREWVFATDESGRAAFDDAYLVSGDELYLAHDGTPVLPLGTIAIAEIKAPSGYLLPTDAQPVVQQVGLDTGAMEIQGYAEPDETNPTVSDMVARGGLSVRKVDESGEGLADARFVVFNRSEHDVVVDATTYAPGESCLTLTSNGEGIAASLPHILPPGTYEIREQQAPRGYHIDDSWSLSATIPAEGSYLDLTGQPLQNRRKTVDVALVATKTFDGTSQGRTLETGAFAFELCDATGEVLQTKYNDAAGAIRFDPLTFGYGDLEVSHTYHIRERKGDDTEIVYDDHVEEVRIELREVDDALVADVLTDDDGIAFRNRTVPALDMPLTGLGGSHMGWLGTLLALGAGGWTMARRRRGLRP